MSRPPPIDGVAPSRTQLPPGPHATILDALCAKFPSVDRAAWQVRFERSRVFDAAGNALQRDTPHTQGIDVYYYREVADEPRLDVEETLLHADDDLIVVDKPHFLPVMPAGRFATDTLLARLVRRLGNPDIAPLHRIDRLTAGLVLFSARPATRDRYQALFRDRAIHKRYEALAPALLQVAFPQVRETRLMRGEPFFTMREVDGEPNSRTQIDVIERNSETWHYALQPITGRKHQLRVHMAALGAPIANDPLYPAVTGNGDDPATPLALLARSLAFVDPITGAPRRFDSGLRLPTPG